MKSLIVAFLVILPFLAFAYEYSHAREIQKIQYASYCEKSIERLNEHLKTFSDPDQIQEMHLKVLKSCIMFRLGEYENAEKEIINVRKLIMNEYILYKEFMNTYY